VGSGTRYTRRTIERDPTNCYDRAPRQTTNLFERIDADDRIGSLFARRFEHRTERNEVRARCHRCQRLGFVVGRHANRHGSDDAASVRDRQIFLAQVQSIGSYELRDVSAVVHDEGDPGGRAEGFHFNGEGQVLCVTEAFASKLQYTAPAADDTPSDRDGLPSATRVGIDDCVEAPS